MLGDARATALLLLLLVRRDAFEPSSFLLLDADVVVTGVVATTLGVVGSSDCDADVDVDADVSVAIVELDVETGPARRDVIVFFLFFLLLRLLETFKKKKKKKSTKQQI